MKAVWIDPGDGAAGDMLLAALLDAGAAQSAVRRALAGLAVEPVELALEQVRRHGYRAVQARLRCADTETRRGPAEVIRIIEAAPLPAPAAAFAVATFRRLAAAEAEVHGIPKTDVHFHEVGALDAIADVVGCAVALHDLGLLGTGTRVVGPIAVGSGRAQSAHGSQPVPAPAVLALLAAAGAPVAAHTARMELCTPTGAALLCTLATAWGPPPAMTPGAVGVGAGSTDPTTHPNVLRVLIGEARTDADAGWSASALKRVDTTVDDLDPRIWPDLLETLRSVGAADAWCAPVLMRKGRPGHVLSVLVSAELLDTVCRVVFEQTTTLGVRVSSVTRRSLRRDQVEVSVGGRPVRVKRGFLGDRPVTVQPEYDDVRDAARLLERPVAELMESARSLGWITDI